MAGKLLVVWDFDWSLINENSDTWVVDQLRPELRPKMRSMARSSEYRNRWTALMDTTLGMLADEGVSAAELTECVAKVPVFDEMLTALREVHASGVAEQRIISDANSLFIDAVLDGQGCSDCVSMVVTNPAHWEGERLRVCPYHDGSLVAEGLRTKHCHANLCKGAVLRGWIDELKPCGVVYVGDGGGDWGAAVQMASSDLLCARTGEQFGLPRLLARGAGEGERGVVARTRMWTEGAAVLQALREELAAAAVPPGPGGQAGMEQVASM